VCDKWQWRFFFFQFLSIEILEKFDQKIEKLVEFTLPKKIQKISQLLWKNWRNFARKKKHWTAVSRTGQVSTGEHEGDCGPRERHGQSAKRSAPVPGQAGRGSDSGRQTSRKSGFLACQGLWKIAGRATSRASSFMRVC
jgi:hypothetical protein